MNELRGAAIHDDDVTKDRDTQIIRYKQSIKIHPRKVSLKEKSLIGTIHR